MRTAARLDDSMGSKDRHPDPPDFPRMNLVTANLRKSLHNPDHPGPCLHKLVRNYEAYVPGPDHKHSPARKYPVDMHHLLCCPGTYDTGLCPALEKDPLFPEALFLKAQILWEGFENSVEAKRSLRDVMRIVQRDEPLHRWASNLFDRIIESEKKEVK